MATSVKQKEKMTTFIKQIQSSSPTYTSQRLRRMLKTDGTPNSWNFKPVQDVQIVMSLIDYRPTSHWFPAFLNSHYGYRQPDLGIAGHRSTRAIVGYCLTKSKKKSRQPSLNGELLVCEELCNPRSGFHTKSLNRISDDNVHWMMAGGRRFSRQREL